MGNKNLYVWSRNANGNVSATAATVVVKLIPIASFASTILAKNETDGTAALIINLSAASTSSITIPVTYIGTTTATTDYTAPSTVTFNPGETSKTLTINLVNDSVAEGDETIIAILGNSAEHVVGLTDIETVTVSDPEDFPVLTANDLTVTEGAVAEATISLAQAYSYGTVTFNYTTADSTAIAGTNYVTQSGSGSIAAGSMSTKIQMTTLYDNVTPTSSTSKIFTLSLSAVTNVDVTSDETADITIDKAPFYAPLRTSVVPTRGGVSATYTRADGADRRASIIDFEGIIRPVKNGEARFFGARRVENLLTYTETLTNAAWTLTNTSSTASRTAQQVVLGANAGDKIRQSNKTVVVGQKLVYSITVSGAGTFVMTLYDGNGAALTTKSILLTGTATRYSVAGTIATAGTTAGVGIVSNGAGSTVNVTSIQLENVHGQTNQNPSEYVSCSVLSTPFHGAGIDCVKYFDIKNGNVSDVGTNLVTYDSSLATALPINANLIANSGANPTTSASASVTSGLSGAPNGTTTAKRVNVDSGVSDVEGINYALTGLIPGSSYDASMYVKADTATTVSFGIYDPTASAWLALADYDLIAKTVTTHTGSATPIRSAITYVGNSWYRISIAAATTSTGTAATVYLYPHLNGTQSTNDAVYFWGPQFELGESAGPYLPTTGGSAVAFYMRGLLNEVTSANKFLQSEDFNTSWTKTNITVTTNVGAITAPSGLSTADKIVEDASAGVEHRVEQTIAKASNASANYALSVYLKSAEKSKVALRITNSTEGSGVQAIFDLSAGVVSSAAAIYGAAGFTIPSSPTQITPVGNGWYRCSLMSLTDANGSVNIKGMILLTDATGTTTSYNGDNSSGIYAWGAQLELTTTYAVTSYIPTTTSAIQRAVDKLIYPMSIANIAGSGSMQASFQLLSSIILTNSYYVAAGDGNSRFLYITGNSSKNTVKSYDGVKIGLATNGAYAVEGKGLARASSRWTPSVITANWEDTVSIAPVARTTGTFGTATDIGIGNIGGAGGSNPNGYYRDVFFWNRYLGDTEVYLPGFSY